MIQGFREAEEDVLTRAGFSEVVLRTPAHHDETMLYELFEHRFQGHRMRDAVHETHHVHMERVFELRVLIEIIQDLLRVCARLELDDDTDVFGRFVADVADAFYLLLADEIGDLDDEL